MNRTITAVPGVLAGHWTHPSGTTGVTVLRFPGGVRGGLQVPGSATGSREWGALDPDHVAGAVHGLCLAGGSAFGLAAADGVMQVLEADGEGFDTGFGRVPIVPAAILFDLHSATARPDAAGGAAAARSASTAPLEEGRVGAAAGALVGVGSGAPRPGGLGSWASEVQRYVVGAVAAVNAVGDLLDRGVQVDGDGLPASAGSWRGQTTLVAVATDAPLDRARCRILAKMATAGMARALRPAFTPFDGDVVFAFSTGSGTPVDNATLAQLGDAAAEAVARAIARGVG